MTVKENTMTKKQLRALRAAVDAAESAYESARQRLFRQRPITQQAINDDILARAGGLSGIPRPMRGDNAPLLPSQVKANQSRAILSDLEATVSAAAAAMNAAKGEWLAAKNRLFDERRNHLADRIIAGSATEAETEEFASLCPPPHEVRIDEQFTLSPRAQHAMTLIRGSLDEINTPCDQLSGVAQAPLDYQAACDRVLEHAF